MTLLADMASDIDAMYDATFGFAETVTGAFGSILGVFDHEYLEADPEGSVIVSARAPVLRTRDTDALDVGDNCIIRSVTYAVVEVEPDGGGETLHRLRAV